jgi:hypothetical protein
MTARVQREPPPFRRLQQLQRAHPRYLPQLVMGHRRTSFGFGLPEGQKEKGLASSQALSNCFGLVVGVPVLGPQKPRGLARVGDDGAIGRTHPAAVPNRELKGHALHGAEERNGCEPHWSRADLSKCQIGGATG